MQLFVSYTTRDNCVTREFLESFKSSLVSAGISVYIDLLDNHASDPQTYVMKMIESADIICLLLTSMFMKSPWVQKELSVAKAHNIPTISVSFEQAATILENREIQSEFIKKLQTIYKDK